MRSAVLVLACTLAFGCAAAPPVDEKPIAKAPVAAAPAADGSKWFTAYRYRLKSRLDDDDLVLAAAEKIEFVVVSAQAERDAGVESVDERSPNFVAVHLEITNHRDETVWYSSNTRTGPNVRGAARDEGQWRRVSVALEMHGPGDRWRFAPLPPGGSISKTAYVNASDGSIRFSLYFSDHDHDASSNCDCNYLRYRELWTEALDLEPFRVKGR